MTKVFITDDHLLIRAGLKQILAGESDLRVVGEAQNCAETIRLVEATQPDLLVLDIALPDRSGLDALMEIKQRFPRIRVLMLSMFPEDRFALRTLKAGADGYLTKGGVAEELVLALRRIASGRRYVSQELSQQLLESVGGDEAEALHEVLSPREFEVFRKIGAGRTITQIAEELNLSVSTVNTHRAHILQKMGMHTNAELMHYAIENRLVV